MIKTSFIILLIQIALKGQSQSIDFKTFLYTNNFKLIDIKYNMHSHMEDIEKGYFYYPENSYRAKMEMKTIIYDTTKAEHKKILKNLKFKQKDTVLIYDWDQQADFIPYNETACKVKYSHTDSALVFYNANDIERHAKKTNNPFMPTRKFKMIKLEKDKFTLLDLDFKDVRRIYIFKKVIK